jgi:hypothetical protein
VAVSVEGQFYLSFSVGNEEDFLTLNELLEFTTVEEAGNVIPTFELHFRTNREAVLGLLHEGNDLKVSFGRSSSETEEYFLSVTELQSNDIGNFRQISCVGMLSKLRYLVNPKKSITDSLSGVEVLKTIAENNGFFFDSNIEKSQDAMNWIQPNIPDRKFVSNICKHSYIPDSFLAHGISMDGRFVLRDIRKLGKETEPKWLFVQKDPTSDSEILYEPNPKVETNSGFLNYWLGYGQEQATFSLEDEDLRSISEDIKPSVALTEDVARRSDIEKRYQGTALQNENTHPNYWKAALQNLTNLAMFGALQVTTSFNDDYKDIRVLDLVSYSDPSIDASSPLGSSKAQSGLYIVSKVARSVVNKQLATTVILVRESMNDISGEVREAQDAPEFDEEFGVSDKTAELPK